MGQLGKFVRLCFGLEALSLIAGIPIFLIAAFRLSLKLGWQQASSSLFLLTELLALGTLALQMVPAIAWWTLKKGNRHARAWALAASVVNVLPLPAVSRSWIIFSGLKHSPAGLISALIGVAGLIAFWRRPVVSEVADATKPKPRRLPGDGTSKTAERLAGVVAVAWLFFCLHWWRVWARGQHLRQSDFLVWVAEVQVAVLICIAIHEFGHVLAGWVSDMKLRSFQVGPFRWFHRRGRWKFKLLAGMGGVTGMAPTRLTNVRGWSAFFTFGGPVASLVLAGISCIATLTAKGHFWEGSWALLSLIATIASLDFMVNLIPLKPEAQYSDGARIYQLVTNGPWAQVEQAFSMVASSLVTSRRPLRRLKTVLMLFHPHSPSPERHAFGLQAQSLLEAVLARQHDFSTGAHHPMPGQATCPAQRPDHLPGASWKAGSARDVAIRGHFTFRNCSNGVANGAEQSRPIARGTKPGCGAAPARA